MGPDSQYAWLTNYLAAAAEIEGLIPEGGSVVLIDNGSLGAEFLPRHHVLSFPQHDGEFSGSPCDEQQAIQELEQHQNDGVQWIVLAFSAFWWLDAYPRFFNHLCSQSDCVLENERLRIFSLRSECQPTVKCKIAESDANAACTADVVDQHRLAGEK